jgi:hypothetical protein
MSNKNTKKPIVNKKKEKAFVKKTAKKAIKKEVQRFKKNSNTSMARRQTYDRVSKVMHSQKPTLLGRVVDSIITYAPIVSDFIASLITPAAAFDAQGNALVTIPAGEILFQMSLDPFWGTTRLSKEASAYQKYKFQSLKVDYDPSTTVLTSGSICIFIDTDPRDVFSATGTDMVNIARAHGGSITQVAQPTTVHLPNDKVDWLYCDPSGDADPRLSQQAQIIVVAVTDLPLGTTLGSLSIDYKIAFKTPSFEGSHSSDDGEVTDFDAQYYAFPTEINIASNAFYHILDELDSNGLGDWQLYHGQDMFLHPLFDVTEVSGQTALKAKRPVDLFLNIFFDYGVPDPVVADPYLEVKVYTAAGAPLRDIIRTTYATDRIENFTILLSLETDQSFYLRFKAGSGSQFNMYGKGAGIPYYSMIDFHVLNVGKAPVQRIKTLADVMDQRKKKFIPKLRIRSTSPGKTYGDAVETINLQPKTSVRSNSSRGNLDGRH